MCLDRRSERLPAGVEELDRAVLGTERQRPAAQEGHADERTRRRERRADRPPAGHVPELAASCAEGSEPTAVAAEGQAVNGSTPFVKRLRQEARRRRAPEVQ